MNVPPFQFLAAGLLACLAGQVFGVDSQPAIAIRVNATPNLLAQPSAVAVTSPAAGPKFSRLNVLRVALRTTAPVVDGKLDDWSGAEWARIDETTSAALCFTSERLYAAFRTQEHDLLQNSGQSLPTLFASGGALDLLLATNLNAKPRRQVPTVGDLRLVVTRVDGNPAAMLYRPIAPGSAQPVVFSSPAQSVTFDRVDDLSAKVELASATRISAGPDPRKPAPQVWEEYEFSVALEDLSLHGPPGKAGQFITGDLGILRGSAGVTTQRAYWHNKTIITVRDAPSEAVLAPPLWGRLELVQP